LLNKRENDRANSGCPRVCMPVGEKATDPIRSTSFPALGALTISAGRVERNWRTPDAPTCAPAASPQRPSPGQPLRLKPWPSSSSAPRRSGVRLTPPPPAPASRPRPSLVASAAPRRGCGTTDENHPQETSRANLLGVSIRACLHSSRHGKMPSGASASRLCWLRRSCRERTSDRLDGRSFRARDLTTNHNTRACA
jgi:hypothetical protein